MASAGFFTPRTRKSNAGKKRSAASTAASIIEAAPASVGRSPVGDHVDLARHVPAERRGARMRAQAFGIDRDVDGRQSQLAEGLAHDLLAGLLSSQERGGLDEPHEQRLHRRRLGGYRGLYLVVARPHVGGTSSEGLRSKNPTGLSQNETVSTGITGQSSGRVTWCSPKNDEQRKSVNAASFHVDRA